MESKVIQLILKDTSIWPYLNSTNCLDCITIDCSWSLDTTSGAGTRLSSSLSSQQLPVPRTCDDPLHRWRSTLTATGCTINEMPPLSVLNLQMFLPANYLVQIFHKAQQCYPYEWVTHVWITCTLMSGYKQGLRRTDIRNRKRILKIMHILIQNNSYKQHSFLKASTVI